MHDRLPCVCVCVWLTADAQAWVPDRAASPSSSKSLWIAVQPCSKENASRETELAGRFMLKWLQAFARPFADFLAVFSNIASSSQVMPAPRALLLLCRLPRLYAASGEKRDLPHTVWSACLRDIPYTEWSAY